MADARLVRTPTSSGNRKTFTFAGWVKQNNPAGTNQYLFGAFSHGSNSGYQNTISLSNVDDKAAYFQNTNGTVNSNYKTTALYRDAGNWLHILVAVDTTEGQGVDRAKIYINGARNKSLSITTLTAEGHQANFNSTVQHIIGNWPGLSTDILSQLFDVFWIDGQALTPDVFGFYKDGDGYQSSGSSYATDFRPGQWMPHAPSKIKKDINRRGGFGVNGFYLPMNDSSNPGADFHTTPNSIIKLKGEDLPQPRNGAPTTSDSYVSQLRPEVSTLGFDGCVKMDGTQRLSVADVAALDLGTGDFTIEGFYYLKDEGGYHSLFDFRGTNATGLYPALFKDTTEDKLYYYVNGTTIDDIPMRYGEWMHVVICRSSGTTRAFVDGKLAGSYSDTTNYISSDLYIGMSTSNSHGIHGFVSNFRIVKGTALYTANFTPPTSPLENVTNTILLCANSSTSATASTVTPSTITAIGSPIATRNELTGSIVLAVPGILDKVDLVTNGTFDSNTTGWTASNAVISSVNGTLKVDDSANSGSWSSAFQVITTVAGRTYRLELDVLGGNDDRFVGIYQGTYTANSGTAPTINVNGSGYSAPQTVATTFTATGTSISIMLTANNNGIVYFDNVRLYDASVPVDYSADIKGSGTNKTIAVANNANTAVVPSYYGSAMAFDGTTDAFQYTVPNNDALFLQSNSFTMECWVYPNTSFTDDRYMISLGSGSSANSDGSWYLRIYDTYYQGIMVNSNTQYQTTSATAYKSGQWTHVAYVRDGNEQRLYINGACESVTTHSVLPNVNNNSTLFIGSSYGLNNSINAQIQDVRIYDGVAKYKGGFDVPKPYTPVGVEAFRTISDTCKNNFATLNPLLGVGRQDQLTYSDGNLKVVSGATGGSDTTAVSTMAIKGKIYCEFALTNDGLGAYVGVMKYNTALTNNGVDTTASSDCWLIRGDNEHKANGGGGSGTSYGSGTFSTGDIIMLAVDIGNTSIWFGKNGTWYASGNPATNSNAAYTNLPSTEDLLVMCGDNYSSETPTIIANFGQNPSFSGTITAGTNADGNGKGLFKYAPPSGFLALCEDNLPTPAIADPGEHFKSVIYTGSSGDGRSIRGVGFQPDLIWIKKRNNTSDHRLFDSVRGVRKALKSNSTGAEFSNDAVMSFDNDGWSASAFNANGDSYVAWCWKAGGPAVTNNDGSITSQVSANRTAGFSIVSYTGNNTTNTTVGHGLGKTPSVVITKSRSNVQSPAWHTSHVSLDANYDVALDSTSAAWNPGSNGWHELTSSSVFTLKNGSSDGNNVNRNGDNYIAYCWAEIEGYSKFGSYKGNGSTDGPFVYCGFKPAFLLVKLSSTTNGHWVLWDSSRTPTNLATNALSPNNTWADTANFDVDLLSNGFKQRDTETSLNVNGNTYIFLAFAESPFKTANAK